MLLPFDDFCVCHCLEKSIVKIESWLKDPLLCNSGKCLTSSILQYHNKIEMLMSCILISLHGFLHINNKSNHFEILIEKLCIQTLIPFLSVCFVKQSDGAYKTLYSSQLQDPSHFSTALMQLCSCMMTFLLCRIVYVNCIKLIMR